MRLSKQQHDAIVTTFLEVFGRGEIRLFGSRVRDDLRGGDIDLYVNPDETDQLAMKRVTYLARLKRKIGEQKIDLVLAASPAERAIDQEAQTNGVVLCQRH
ncbi:hypothetical protein D5125_15110 [Magnetovirga frankeli]|jgi:predicted nucleotidyltransferase|uniref:nucleotidyltransferase domain-containing protein n=1 Tax=Magnetovirga frankeli TaxID=947516 RepID=UPI001293428D|nr:hypothetical protein D5125_15110 [gamma proteobacterium SS-5]